MVRGDRGRRVHAECSACRGGQAASFICSRRYVQDCSRLAAETSVASGTIEVRTHAIAQREHGYDREFFDLVRADFTALASADPRWR
jgi:hypothetical protein